MTSIQQRGSRCRCAVNPVDVKIFQEVWPGSDRAGAPHHAVAQMVAVLAGHGYGLAGRPSEVISDGLRWETAGGRVVRVARGVYAYGQRAEPWWPPEDPHGSSFDRTHSISLDQ